MQIVTYDKTVDPQTFETKLNELRKRLLVRLSASSDFCSPAQTPLLRQKRFIGFLTDSQNPVDFDYMFFAFKKKKDPAKLYPLRYIRGVTTNGEQYYVGSTSKNKNAQEQSEFKLADCREIQKITTFYAMAKQTSGSRKERYKTRILAFVIQYVGLDQQSHEALIASPNGDFPANADKDPNQGIADNLKEYIKGYQDTNYTIAFQENSKALNFYPDPNSPQKRIKIPNIAYETVTGASKDYISNLALISAYPMKPSELVPANVTKMVFNMPFFINPTGKDVELSLEKSDTEMFRNVIISQKVHNFSVSIPSVSVGMHEGPSVAIGQIAGYSYNSTTGTEEEQTRTRGEKSTLNLTIPSTAFVVDEFPSNTRYLVNNEITLTTSDNEELTVTVPTNVPAFSVDGADGLAEAILTSI